MAQYYAKAYKVMSAFFLVSGSSYQNAPKMRLAAGLCPDQLGELTVLPGPSAWIKRKEQRRRRKGMGERRKGEKGRKGV